MNDDYPLTPDQLYGELYYQIQLKHIFSDTKTFVDSLPKYSSKEILQFYEEQKNSSHFDLTKFVFEYFLFPCSPNETFPIDISISIVDHINRLWEILSRPADQSIDGSSRIPLPFPYVVPGGRFQEIFYWDSYFTMLGLALSPSRFSLIQNMIDNFAYLIDQFGYIPNGNRTYFLSRSQPPFFSLMIQLLAQLNQNPNHIYNKYLPQLHKEYLFWMKEIEQLNENNIFHRHVVRLSDGRILNRYWDGVRRARPEAYPKEEDERKRAKERFGIDSETFYLHNRSACESGWDFSSRWFKDGISKESNRCAEIIPIDLNCLLYHLENLLSQIYKDNNQIQLTNHFHQLAQTRKTSIQTLFWSNSEQFFLDYDVINNCHTSILSLAALYPLFFQIATEEQAEYVQQRLEKDFLQMGGLQTTLHRTGQQWDSPNGWAPLQWISYQALQNYGFHQLANEIRSRWLNLNEQVYCQTGKLTEKYNVMEYKNGGGGNYPTQDGFGWTNGVYLRLLHG